MKGLVKRINHKKGYGFIYGTGSVEKDGKENVLPEYFFHLSQVKSKHIEWCDMVKFEPHMDKKGMSARNISVIKCLPKDDPRAYIANRIDDEFDMKIPYITWVNIMFEDMKELYNYLKANKENDEEEFTRISGIYGLNKIPEDEHVSCIAAGGYELWKYDKEQMKNMNIRED